MYSKLSFFMTIHLSIFLKLYKSLFNLLYFLHLWIQHTFPSANPIFCFSIFYAVTASTFPCLRSLFSAPQFFMWLWRLLFLLQEACFLFLSFLSDHGLHLSFHNATLVRIMFTTLYPKWSPPSVSKSAHYTISARNNIMPWQSNTATSINYMASRSVLQTTNHLHQPSDPLLNCLFSNINKYFQIPIKSFTMSVRHIHTQAQTLG